MPLVPGTKLGPYEIVSPLGAGGMGEVYRASDTRLGRDVAVKILPKEMSADPQRKQRFEREARTISSLNHPHICVLHDIGSQDGVDYLVMECVEGETLAKRLEKGSLPLEQVLKYGAQIADALDKELDGRSDIFSLGAVLYEVVTGKKAFEGKSQLSVASAILEKEPAPVSSIKPMTPPALDHTIRRCLAKDPDDRWQSARDLALELESVSSADSAPSSSALSALSRSRNRRELFAWSIASAALLTLVAHWFLRPRDSFSPLPTYSFIDPPATTSFQIEEIRAHRQLSRRMAVRSFSVRATNFGIAHCAPAQSISCRGLTARSFHFGRPTVPASVFSLTAS